MLGTIVSSGAVFRAELAPACSELIMTQAANVHYMSRLFLISEKELFKVRLSLVIKDGFRIVAPKLFKYERDDTKLVLNFDEVEMTSDLNIVGMQIIDDELRMMKIKRTNIALKACDSLIATYTINI
jgi:hypothetical protein